MKSTKFFSALTAATALVAFAGCGAPAAPTTEPPTPAATAPQTSATADPNAALQALVPEGIRTAGVLKVAISLAYPPMEYPVEAGSEELVGVDIELAQEVAKRLALTIEFDNVDFEQLIPSVTTGRDHLIWTAMSDYIQRQEKLDFVDYFRTGDAFFAPAAAKDSIKDLKDLCGKTVTVATGTNWGKTVQELSKTICTDGTEISTLEIETLAEQKVQMKTGRAQVILLGLEGGADLSPNEYYHFGELLSPNNSGVGVSKENAGLRDAVQGALTAMAADGTYQAILDKYNCGDAAVSEFTINDGVEG
ncbi:MAG: transporter substrate-binding domain-containing protein [Propionibacteriaceae bacterium]|jgi:polar amino acid transport system substrate-binding protein|nr:transporter substrate-binding domain-containing protein [Propionibacteriaceae bacterium]